jgi:hypothetical protein
MQGDKSWEAVILEDFAELQKAGLTDPLMQEIEKAFRWDLKASWQRTQRRLPRDPGKLVTPMTTRTMDRYRDQRLD